MKVTLHPDAEQDIMDAASFYEREGSAALAARFVREFGRVAELIGEYPEIGAPRGNGLRGVAMVVFPYTVIYRSGTSLTKILVVKHNRRHPNFGSKRS